MIDGARPTFVILDETTRFAPEGMREMSDYRCPQCGVGRLAVRCLNSPDEYTCGHLGMLAMLTVDDFARTRADQERRLRERVTAIIAAARAEPWLPEATWTAQPRPDASHFTIVHDPDVGTLAELTTSDGHRFYGFDPRQGSDAKLTLELIAELRDNVASEPYRPRYWYRAP